MDEITLDDLCLDVIDCEHKTAPEDPLGPYWSIGTSAMAGNKIDLGQAKRISRVTYEAWTRRGRPQPGDIILAREAPVGPVVRVPTTIRVALGQRTVLLRPNPERIDPGFMYYALVGDEMQSLMRSRAEGSTVAHLNVAEVRELRFIERPSLAEQRAIAGVLGALDDKIESNRRIESLTTALIRAQWELSAQGAPRGRIGQLVVQLKARVSRHDGSATVMSATSAGRLVPSDAFFNKRVYSAELSKYLLVPPWSFAYNPSRANIGSIGLNASSIFGAVSPVYVVAQPSTPASAWWVELALRTPSVRAAIDAYSSGSVRQVLRFEDFASIEIPLPSTKEIDDFYADSQVLLERNEQVQDENLALQTLRDALLPELLSGRLRVKDAEKVVEGGAVSCISSAQLLGHPLSELDEAHRLNKTRRYRHEGIGRE